MRVLRLIELDGSPDFIEKTLRLSYTHEQSLEVQHGCFVTGTLLPESALLDPEVEAALRTLRAHAKRLPDRLARVNGDGRG